MKRAGNLLLLFVATSWTCVAACNWGEVPTSVRVTSGPAFVLSGSGDLASFTVFAPRAGRRIAVGSSELDTVVWQIKASKGYFKGTRVEHLQFVYGKLPDGYKQTVPSQSHGAPPLAPGVVYGFFAETTNAPGIGGSFYLTGSGPAQIDVPGLCLRLIERRDVAVKCGTNEPYEEPADLAKCSRTPGHALEGGDQFAMIA
jgi:hypothetical protein